MQSKLKKQPNEKYVKKNLHIAEIVSVITYGEVIKENEIVDLNVLFLNLSHTFQVLFTIFVKCIAHDQSNNDRKRNSLFASNAMHLVDQFN